MKVLNQTNITATPPEHSSEHGIYYLRGTKRRMNETMVPFYFPAYRVRDEEINLTRSQMQRYFAVPFIF